MKKILSAVLLFGFLLSGNLLLYAQKKGAPRIIRMEVASGNTDSFHMAPMGSHGLLIFYESTQVNTEGKRLWYFALFDNMLRQKWLRPVPLTDQLYFVKEKRNSQKVFFVFRHSKKVKRGSGFYDILVYDIGKQTFSSVRGTMPLKAKIADFAISGNELALGLNLENHKADILFVDTRSGSIRVTHLTQPKNVFIDGVFSSSSNGAVIAVANNTENKSTVLNMVYVFNPDGTLRQKIPVSYFDPMSRLSQFVLASATENQIQFFGAVHLVTKGRFFGNDEEDNPNTEGLFYLDLVNGKQKNLRVFNFLDFKNIQGTFGLGSYRKESGKGKNAAKKPTTLSLLNITRPVVHRTIEGYLVSANAYVAYYKTESHMQYDFYGNMFPTDYRVFAGYRFYDVILAGFSKDGKMLWDNDFPMQNILSFRIDDKALVYPDSSVVTVAYVSQGQIITQDIYRDKKMDAREKVNIVSRYPRDRAVGSGENKMIHWYGHYFLVFGYQELKNRALQNQPLRTVFYVNKVTLQ
ncbi:hypothetical protein LA303_02445 [Candidatus Sulfidibacterium hydrothermale]|uniref:hypothetical protein n=1 Tax=Candidatus Sulfidibacterium hydrothermale TaxID=2875962 RepID=UPI001F0B2457|nr:hypothetical protein [Candidatus Sulfidibacterium hydrothermale]UBM62850.1 hypothetical protein LA303_02445 [Candidatus Sulfidibacterium hydrothermale]